LAPPSWRSGSRCSRPRVRGREERASDELGHPPGFQPGRSPTRPVITRDCRRILALLICTASTLVSAAETDSAAIDSFMARVFALAEDGRLFEPAYVARMLDVHADFRVETSGSMPLDCSALASYRRTVVASWTPPWAKKAGAVPSASGVEVPPDAERFARSASEYGNLQVTYRFTEATLCPSSFSFLERKEASVIFENIPSFTCASLDPVRERLRRYRSEPARPRHHGDGPLYGVFHGRQDTLHGSQLTFEYWRDKRCPQIIRVTQDTSMSTRHGRAEAAWRACTATAMTAFCERFPAIRSRRAAISYAEASCGSLQGRLDNPGVVDAPQVPKQVLGFESKCGDWP